MNLPTPSHSNHQLTREAELSQATQQNVILAPAPSGKAGKKTHSAVSISSPVGSLQLSKAGSSRVSHLSGTLTIIVRASFKV